MATGGHGHYVWLVFDTHQKLFDFKINVFLEFAFWVLTRIRKHVNREDFLQNLNSSFP